MFDHNSYKFKMSKTIDVFSKELSSLRTGRANSGMLDLIKVDVYGQKMPINQIATITTPEPRSINIQVWDLNNVSLIDSAIKKSELGLNPQIDGQLIRVPIPKLSEERRKEVTKIASEYAENSKVSIRNIRRDFVENRKKKKKDLNTSEDDLKKILNNIQQITDTNIEKIDKKVKNIITKCEEFSESSPFPDKSIMYDVVYEQKDYPFIKEFL